MMRDILFQDNYGISKSEKDQSIVAREKQSSRRAGK